MDNLTESERSERMSRIRGDDLKPEKAMESALVSEGAGFAFDRNRKDLPGKPDFVVWQTGAAGKPLALFVHGCFWHGCPEHYKTPKTRSAHWDAHVWKNKARDLRVRRKLRALGYRTAVVWEHQTRKKGGPEAAARKLLQMLAAGNIKAARKKTAR